MTRVNFTPENISDDETPQGVCSKSRNNFNYIQIALNAIQAWTTQSFSDVQATIVKSGFRGLFRLSTLAINGSATDRGYGIFGASGSTQIQIDNDEIQAMDDVTPATLYLNFRGGNVIIGAGGSATRLVINNQALFAVTAWNHSLATGPLTKTVDETVGVYCADTTAGNVIYNLPSASPPVVDGRVYTFLKTDTSANTVTVTPFGAQTIDGSATVVLGGNTGRSRLVIYSDGANWRILELYEEGTYTATLTGCTTSPTVTVKYVRTGSSVIMSIPPTNGSSNSTACTYTGCPSFLWPVSYEPICNITEIKDNGVAYTGYIVLRTTGIFEFGYRTSATAETGTFTNFGTKGPATLVNLSYQIGI